MEESGRVSLNAGNIQKLQVMRWIYCPGLAAITLFAVVRVGRAGHIWGNSFLSQPYLYLGLVNAAMQPSDTWQAKAKTAVFTCTSWFVGNLAWWGLYGLAFIL